MSHEARDGLSRVLVWTRGQLRQGMAESCVSVGKG